MDTLIHKKGKFTVTLGSGYISQYELGNLNLDPASTFKFFLKCKEKFAGSGLSAESGKFLFGNTFKLLAGFRLKAGQIYLKVFRYFVSKTC